MVSELTIETKEQIKRAYQIGYSHGMNGQPALENEQILRVLELMGKTKCP